MHSFASMWKLSLGSNNAVWQWTCKNGYCNKERISQNFTGTALSLPACRLFCSQFAAIWPQPTGTFSISKDRSLVQVNVNSIDILAAGVERKEKDDLIRGAGNRFREAISRMGTSEARNSGGRSLVVELQILDKGKTDQLRLDTKEHYNLTVGQTQDGRVSAVIAAENFFGARHGLETLSQVPTTCYLIIIIRKPTSENVSGNSRRILNVTRLLLDAYFQHWATVPITK